METDITLAYEYRDEIRCLFKEYTDMLVAYDPSFAEYLLLQNYEEEVSQLETRYGLPGGRLYLARVGGRAAGCIGLKKLDSQRCEMKRLYVRGEFRGMGIARSLVDRIIADARACGYGSVLLDTLPFLQDALRLYEKVGFYKSAPYNDSPLESSIFMRLDL